jgi:hypothetical protein
MPVMVHTYRERGMLGDVDEVRSALQSEPGDDEEETNLHDLKPFPILLFPNDSNEIWPDPLMKSAVVSDIEPDVNLLRNPMNQP